MKWKNVLNIIMVLVIAMAFLPGCVKYSSGSRTGRLVKFSEKGFFNKSGEGELLLSEFMMKSQSPTKSAKNVFDFSVDNESPEYAALVKQLNGLVGKNITIHYEEEWIVSPGRADTSYLVKRIELAE